jgi:thiamine kinase-like enzyme
MKVKLHVSYPNKSGADVEASAPDLIAFEQEFDKSFTIFSDMNSVRYTHCVWLAWHVLHRTGKTKESFNDWIASIESVEGLDSDEIVPLEISPSTGS